MLVSSAETKRAFKTGVDSDNLHRPTVAPNTSMGWAADPPPACTASDLAPFHPGCADELLEPRSKSNSAAMLEGRKLEAN